MKNKTKVILLLLLTIPISNFYFVGAQSGMRNGLNYSSAGWSYTTSTTTLRRDFELFEDNGINLICLVVHWDKTQPYRDSDRYDTGFLDNIVRVCTTADDYGIEVIIDFHTLYDQGYGMPSFISPNRFATVVTSSSARQEWLEMQEYVINYLESRTTNIHSWHIMNEPLTESGLTTLSDFIDLWEDMTQVFRANTNKDISIRFGCENFNSYWKQNSEIYQLLDYITLNWYPNKGERVLKGSLETVRQHGLEAMIGEYGLGSWNDDAQETSYEYQLALFENNDIRITLAWHYGDYVGGHGYNIWYTAQNRLRPAFDVVVKYNSRYVPPPPPQEYTLTISSATGGTTNPSVGTYTYDEGESVRVTAIPENEYEFVSWEIDGQTLTDNPAYVLMSRDQSITPVFRYVEPQPPSVFLDDFESGDFSEWTGTTRSSGESVAVVNTLPYEGTYHGRFTLDDDAEADYASCYRTINEEEVWASGHFYVASGLPLENDDDRFYFIHFTSGRNYLAGVGIRRHEGSDKWVLYGRNGSGWVGPIYSILPTIEMNRWYCVELHWKKHATHCIVETYVDGEKILAIEGIDAVSFGNVSRISFGLTLALQVQKKLDIYGDCFAASNVHVGSYAFGDVNHDGSVDILDLSIVALSVSCVPDDPRWNPDADLNKDGTINMVDIVIVAMSFGS